MLTEPSGRGCRSCAGGPGDDVGFVAGILFVRGVDMLSGIFGWETKRGFWCGFGLEGERGGGEIRGRGIP